MAAKGNIPSGFAGIQPLAGLEPLALGIDQRDQCYLGTEYLPGQAGQAVEALLGRRIQNSSLTQCFQT